MADPPIHAGIVAGALYNDAARSLVLAFKHGGKIGLAPLLARLISSRLPRDSVGELPLLVPVPLHPWRLWHRGYNQAALLAREMQRHGKGELWVDLLIRKKRTRPLGGLGKSARAKALQGAIAVSPKRSSILAGRDVILVDDVLTSGATSDACVKVLLSGGARSVKIACFARVLEESMIP
jgi:ComF family protein